MEVVDKKCYHRLFFFSATLFNIKLMAIKTHPKTHFDRLAGFRSICIDYLTFDNILFERKIKFIYLAKWTWNYFMCGEIKGWRKTVRWTHSTDFGCYFSTETLDEWTEVNNVLFFLKSGYVFFSTVCAATRFHGRRVWIELIITVLIRYWNEIKPSQTWRRQLVCDDRCKIKWGHSVP